MSHRTGRPEIPRCGSSSQNHSTAYPHNCSSLRLANGPNSKRATHTSSRALRARSPQKARSSSCNAPVRTNSTLSIRCQQSSSAHVSGRPSSVKCSASAQSSLPNRQARQNKASGSSRAPGRPVTKSRLLSGLQGLPLASSSRRTSTWKECENRQHRSLTSWSGSCPYKSSGCRTQPHQRRPRSSSGATTAKSLSIKPSFTSTRTHPSHTQLKRSSD